MRRAAYNFEDCSFERLEIGWLPTFIGRLITLHDEIQRHDLSLEQVAQWCRERGDDVALCRLDAIGALRSYRELKRGRNATLASSVRRFRERRRRSSRRSIRTRARSCRPGG